MPPDIKALIQGCASGNEDAQTAFQQLYGPLIYTFAVRIFHLSEDDSGDFYLYVFEQGRLFKRVRSFEGRNAIQFETFLSHFVLRDLCLEWLRKREKVVMVPLHTPVAGSASESTRKTLQDILPADDPMPDTALVEADDMQRIENAINQLEPEKRLILKLLALDVIELQPEDIRLIARSTSRSLRETLECIDTVRAALAAKSMQARETCEHLHSVAYWIYIYQREMATLVEQINAMRQQDEPGETQRLERLTQEHAELERKLAWRYEQHAKLREELWTSHIRPSYRDIATILKVPVGTISSRIARARGEFGGLLHQEQ